LSWRILKLLVKNLATLISEFAPEIAKNVVLGESTRSAQEEDQPRQKQVAFHKSIPVGLIGCVG
jgi:hypothetical protein